MKYYIIVGEASGDLHGSNLMKSLLKQDSEAQFRFWGGDLMEAVGGEQVMHYKERAIMGFTEVIRKLGTAIKNIKYCKEDINQYQPDALIFMDYSGFNLRIAKWAKPQGFNTHYYISPQVWASRESRVKTIKETINHMYVILPFVKDFYEQKYNYPVEFVGHPIIDAIDQHESVDHVAFLKEYNLDDRPLIALLPGSRKQEISKMLGVMLQMVDKYPAYQFLIAGSPGQEASFYKPFLKENVALVMNRTYDILSLCHAALVTSGTATLETALFKVPQVVCYKGSSISYRIAKMIIKLDYISLVNLIMDKMVVTELIQTDFNVINLKKELDLILSPTQRNRIFEDYYELEKDLGGVGASNKVASLIIKNSQK